MALFEIWKSLTIEWFGLSLKLCTVQCRIFFLNLHSLVEIHTAKVEVTLCIVRVSINSLLEVFNCFINLVLLFKKHTLQIKIFLVAWIFGNSLVDNLVSFVILLFVQKVVNYDANISVILLSEQWISFLCNGNNSFVVVRDTGSNAHRIIINVFVLITLLTSLFKSLQCALQVFSLPSRHTLIETNLGISRIRKFRTEFAKVFCILKITENAPCLSSINIVLCIVETITCIHKVVDMTGNKTYNLLSVLGFELWSTSFFVNFLCAVFFKFRHLVKFQSLHEIFITFKQCSAHVFIIHLLSDCFLTHALIVETIPTLSGNKPCKSRILCFFVRQCCFDFAASILKSA